VRNLTAKRIFLKCLAGYGKKEKVVKGAAVGI